MDHRVGELQIGYRIPASTPQAHAAIPGFDRISRHQLADACQSAIDELLGSDPAVYVLREVNARMAIQSAGAALTGPVARAWGERIAGAAARVLARGDEGIDFVKFDDQADFVARFIGDLVGDNAASLWFYGAFAHYLAMPKQQAIVRVLEDNREYLAAILRLLRERGQLDSILNLLDVENARAIGWFQKLPGNRLNVEAWRPVLMAAAGIAQALGATVAMPAEHDIEWFESLHASLALPSAEPDWKDPLRLAAHVLHVLAFLSASGHLRWAETNRLEMNSGQAREILSARFDWLPLDWLVPRVLELRSGTASTASFGRPVSAAHSPTPRQRQFLEVLLRLARYGKLDLRQSQRTGMAYDRLRIRAALAAETPSFCDDPHLMGILDALLVVRDNHMTPDSQPASVALERSRKIVASLGPPAEELLQTLSAPPVGIRVSASSGEAFATDCGAIFLLTRGVMDLRLDAILKSAGVDPPHPFLAGLAMKIGGVLDQGARVWSGYEGELLWPDLANISVGRFHQALCETMVAQRHFPDETFRFAPDALGPLGLAIESCPAELDGLLTETAACVIRAWARWLRGIGESSPAYLLKNTLDRKARVEHDARAIEVTLQPAPLDSIVELSGYFAPISRIPWLGHREMRFVRGTR